MAKRTLTDETRLDRIEAQLSRAAVLIDRLADEGVKQRADLHELGVRMDELGVRMDGLGARMDNYARSVVLGFTRAATQHNDLEDRVAAIDKRLTILEHEVHS